MTKPPKFIEHVDYQQLQAIYAQNTNVILYAEERNELPPTFYDPPRAGVEGYLVTSLRFIEFITSGVKVGSVFRLYFAEDEPADILWWLQVADTLYMLRPDVP
jgi:hypothetical protein